MLVGRGVLRNPWILAQAADMLAGRAPRVVTLQDRGLFLLEYIDLLQHERTREPEGFRITRATFGRRDAAGTRAQQPRSLGGEQDPGAGAYYTKGVEGGSELRAGLNTALSVDQLRGLIHRFFEL